MAAAGSERGERSEHKRKALAEADRAGREASQVQRITELESVADRLRQRVIDANAQTKEAEKACTDLFAAFEEGNWKPFGGITVLAASLRRGLLEQAAMDIRDRAANDLEALATFDPAEYLESRWRAEGMAPLVELLCAIVLGDEEHKPSELARRRMGVSRWPRARRASCSLPLESTWSSLTPGAPPPWAC